MSGSHKISKANIEKLRELFRHPTSIKISKRTIHTYNKAISKFIDEENGAREAYNRFGNELKALGAPKEIYEAFFDLSKDEDQHSDMLYTLSEI